VIATCGRRSHRDRFDTDDSFRRQRFAAAALAKFDWEASAEQIAEIDAKLVSEADREDACRPQADAVCLANVAPTDVCWLWPGRIALGKVTLLAGDPGWARASSRWTLPRALSRGTVWPDELRGRVLDSLADPWRDEASGSVILLSAEDDLADTIARDWKPTGPTAAASSPFVRLPTRVRTAAAGSTWAPTWSTSKRCSMTWPTAGWW